MINPPKATKAPTIQRKSVLDWSVGTVTDYDSRRMVEDALKSSVNMVLEQNGVIRPRPSLVQYGPQPDYPILGELFECKKVTGSVSKFYLITMQSDGTNGYIYYCQGEDSVWTKIASKTYDKSAPAHFVQIDEKVLVLNGKDPLSFIDLSNWTITSFNAISDPSSAPSATATGLSGSGFVVYYAITANSSVGETKASPSVSVTVGEDRDFWDPDTQYVELTWTAVTDAVSYNVYMGVSTDGQGAPTMYLLKSSIDATTLSFRDNGNRAVDTTRPAPESNSTDGPKATRGTVVNGRVWLVGDASNPYYVWYGGNYGHELDFSPSGNGGGYVTVAQGTKEIPIAEERLREEKGDATSVVQNKGKDR